MFPFWNFRPWDAPQGHPDPSMCKSMANTDLPSPCMGGFSGRCGPHFKQAQQQQQQQQQQHAMSQAQIEMLKQHNLLLNQQLATQAQSHIQHLQQNYAIPVVGHSTIFCQYRS